MKSIKLHGDKIIFGEKSIENLSKVEGEKAFIVSFSSSKKLGYLEKVISQLKKNNITSQTFTEVEPDPSIETVMKGKNQMLEFNPDIIIGLGGGSAMDAAKAMWAFYEYPNKTFSEIVEENTVPPLGNKAKMIAIPTTSGTGSEVSRSIVITDKKENIKHGIGSMNMLPDLAILEPEFTKSLPSEMTAATGLDAFTHAIEAYVSTKANDFTDVLSLGALENIYKYLPLSYNKPNNLEYREKMLNFQTMSGMAFCNVSLGIVHSLAHQLGGVFHISHGIADAVLLPYVIEFNQKNKRANQKYKKVAKRIGEDGIVNAVKDLNNKLNIPHSLSDLDLKEKEFNEKVNLMAKRAMEDGCTKTNPRKPSIEQMKKIYTFAFKGKKVDF